MKKISLKINVIIFLLDTPDTPSKGLVKMVAMGAVGRFE